MFQDTVFALKIEELRILTHRSRMFYETALLQLERGFYDLAVFSLEQSLQLFLKACLRTLWVRGYSTP